MEIVAISPANPAGFTSQFRLEGPSAALDPRVNAYRPDIADIALANLVAAPYYAVPDLYRLMRPSAMLTAEPGEGAPAISQLLHGETFAVLDVSGGWAWGYCRHDHYVGYLPADMLARDMAEPTHRVTARSALVFSDAGIKSPLVETLPMGALIRTEDRTGDFVRTAHGFIHQRHLGALTQVESDPVAVAERLTGAPYLWGGRSGAGLDCSGLVQLTLGACGIPAPRDSDQQCERLGEEVAHDQLRRGDLVFFPGHVGLMVDAERIIHANAYWMAVTVDPLADVVARLRPDHPEPILAVKRL